MNRKPLVLFGIAALFASGCSDGTDSFGGTPLTVAVFEPSMSRIPVPTDLLFAGTEDLTLNIPVLDPMDTSDPQVALGRLDGWSTNAPFVIEFSRGLDDTTLVEETTVHIFEVTLDTTVTPIGGPIASVVRELTDAEFDLGLAPEDPTNGTIRVFPLVPFTPSTSYLVVLTNGIMDTMGRPVAADAEYELVSSTDILPPTHPFAGLQGITLAARAAAASQGVVPETIVFTNSFTTQSVGATLGTLASIVANGAPAEQAVIDALCASGAVICADTTPQIAAASVTIDGLIGTTATFVPGSPGLANVYAGGLTLPYFLTAASNTSPTVPVTDTAPVSEFWHARYPFLMASGPDTERNTSGVNVLPEMTGIEEVPLLVLTPNSGAAAPWPVVMYSHGVTRDRTDVLLIGDALCAAGFAVVAIDFPLHGLNEPLNPLFTSFQDGGRRERLFGLDLLNNTTFAPVPDGIADTSGQHFINLSSMLTSRDNLRQSVLDLMSLRSVLPAIDVDGGGGDLDATSVSLVGQSFGAVIGLSYLPFTTVDAAVLNPPGAAIAKLLNNSMQFGPTIDAGLAAAGVIPGTSDYEAFFFAAQTAIDTTEPLNFAASVTAAGTPILLTEIIGGGPGGGLPDGTIPNTAPDAPLAGTEPLITVMGLSSITGSTTGSPIQGAIRFIEGVHGSLIDPLTDPAVNTEMQAQTVGFLLSEGTSLTVGDDNLIQTTTP